VFFFFFFFLEWFDDLHTYVMFPIVPTAR